MLTLKIACRSQEKEIYAEAQIVNGKLALFPHFGVFVQKHSSLFSLRMGVAWEGMKLIYTSSLTSPSTHAPWPKCHSSAKKVEQRKSPQTSSLELFRKLLTRKKSGSLATFYNFFVRSYHQNIKKLLLGSYKVCTVLYFL